MSNRIGILVTLIVCGHSGWSQSTTYFDRSAFLEACQDVPGNRQSITFSQDEVPASMIGPVLTLSGVTFTGSYLVRAIGGSYSSLGPVLHQFDGWGPLGIHFGTGARAFGANYSSSLSPWQSSFTATVTLDDGEVFTFTAPSRPDSQFFGFVSPTPIHDVTFSDGGAFGYPPANMHEELIGNLYMVLEVPEPASLGLLALGAAFFLFRRQS